MFPKIGGKPHPISSLSSFLSSCKNSVFGSEQHLLLKKKPHSLLGHEICEKGERTFRETVTLPSTAPPLLPADKGGQQFTANGEEQKGNFCWSTARWGGAILLTYENTARRKEHFVGIEEDVHVTEPTQEKYGHTHSAELCSIWWAGNSRGVMQPVNLNR